MSVTADKVIVELEAKIEGYTARVNQAERQFAAAARSIEGSARRAETATSGAFSAIGKFAAAYLGVETAKAAAEFVDSFTRIENALKVSGLSGSELTETYKKLF